MFQIRYSSWLEDPCHARNESTVQQESPLKCLLNVVDIQPGARPIIQDSESDHALRLFTMERIGETSHACARCRSMRAKSSGDPQCEKCVRDIAFCIYGDRKRGMNKKFIDDPSGEVNQMD
jgi:hypothetical protein